MCEMIKLPFGTYQSYELFINVGTVAGMAVFLFFLWKARGTGGKDILAALPALVTVMFVGSYFGTLVRQLGYMDFQDLKELSDHVVRHLGTHFIGRVLAAALFYPLIYRLFSRVLRTEVTKEKMATVLDSLSFFIVIQHFFNRLSCLMAGCCYGKPYTGPGAIRFPDSVEVQYPVFPSQIFEMAAMAVMLLLLVRIHRKGRHLFGILLLGFGTVIFISELFMDQRGYLQILGVNFIQITALLLCMISLFYFRRYSGHTSEQK